MKLLFLHLLVISNIFCVVLCTKKTAHQESQYIATNRRVKREWVWNQMTVPEEQTNIPYFIGGIKSSKINGNVSNAMYMLEGEFANTRFKVRENTGDIYGYERLDREEKAQYNLTALLVDIKTKKTLEPPETFLIRLIDINDNAPAFTQESYNASVPEMSATDVLVTKITAVDPDDPTVAGHAIVTYKIVQGYEHFKINENTGEIYTLSSYLDREKKASYEVIVQAKDSPGLNGGFSSSATVTIHLKDINDNFPAFTKKLYTFNASEDLRVGEVVGKLLVDDIDEPQNRNAKYTFMKGKYEQWFQIKSNPLTNEGIIILRKPLNYESIKEYRMSIEVTDPLIDLRVANQHRPSSTTEVVINVLDVDEPPEFSKPFYQFQVKEDVKKNYIGYVSATDPDFAKRVVRYSTKTSKDDPFVVKEEDGSIYVKMLDRETSAWHNITVTATELDSPIKKASSVNVYIQVLDVNDNAPEFAEPYAPRVCENTANDLVIYTISATDKDIMVPGMKFTYYSAEKENNFTVVDNKDNTASIIVKNGAFNRDVTKSYNLPIVISDNGVPSLSSTNTLTITICKCNDEGEFIECGEYERLAAASASTIIIILCSLALILLCVLVAFLILRRMRNNGPLMLVKNPAEIREQLVTYDEEGGGEMDTNGYDVSVLNSVRRNMVRSKPDMEAYPSMYAQVQKKPARNGDMFSMIEAKKDDADNDGECLPYDTLHIFGYEGSESNVESLSSLESGSSDSEIDYDVLNEWGPRFKMLADLYGLEHLEEFPY
ncbi:cadherin-5 [Hyla sarda]|uniref:cadherin-5 n=1 Tax=Hyla sarda TaxID=327740 RepID=UPI0024C3B62E|nr:cadherin-5 [Hyla sarda]